MATTPPFIFKELFLQKVKEKGGMVNCHAHLTRAGTLTPEIWEQASALMEKKWILMRDIKKNYHKNAETFKKRIRTYINNQIEQGIIACRTHIDADSIVELNDAERMAEIREEYRGKFILQLVAHPLEGFLDETNLKHDPKKIALFEKAASFCDVIGGLPSRDRAMPNGDDKHLDIIFSIAANQKKDVDAHIDQENNPDEKDTELFIKKTKEHKYEGKITIIHGISLAAQEENYRQQIYKELKEIGANITCCPRAAIGMKQLKNKTSSIHNSIAPIDELIANGINVGIGTDNISDIFIPNSNGDLFDEVNLLADGVRLYDLDILTNIACPNGKKILKIQ